MEKTESPPRRSFRHLPALFALASFSALFIVIGFIAGWELRFTEDVYDAKHNTDTAERAATRAAEMTEQQMLRDIRLLCKPGNW